MAREVRHQDSRRRREDGRPARRHAKCRDHHERQQHERHIKDGGDSARRRRKYPTGHGQHCEPDQHHFDGRPRRRRVLPGAEAHGPSHDDRRDAQGSKPIAGPPDLQFAHIFRRTQGSRRGKCAHQRARRGAHCNGGNEQQHIAHPRNSRRLDQPRSHQRADHGVNRVGNGKRHVSGEAEMVGLNGAGRQLDHQLYRQNKNPIAARRKPQGHEQQAGGWPHDGQFLGVLMQLQAKRHQQRIERGEGGEGPGTFGNSVTREVPLEPWWPVCGRGRRRHFQDLPVGR